MGEKKGVLVFEQGSVRTDCNISLNGMETNQENEFVNLGSVIW